VADLIRRVQSPAKEFRSFTELNEAFYSLMFPGYGLSLGPLDEPICLVSLEIPFSDEERIFALDKVGDGWVLADQFVWSTVNGRIESGRRTSDGIIYLDKQGATLRRSGKPAI
jgi:hypothetical protein